MNVHSAARLLRTDFARYFAVSLLALAVDLAVLSICLRLLDMGLALSAAFGFTAGGIVAYVMSIRWVFRARTYHDTPSLEFGAFVAIGLAGLGITQLVLWLGVTWMGLMPELVKLAAAGITFMFNYLVRRTLLFANPGRNVSARETHA